MLRLNISRNCPWNGQKGEKWTNDGEKQKEGALAKGGKKLRKEKEKMGRSELKGEGARAKANWGVKKKMDVTPFPCKWRPRECKKSSDQLLQSGDPGTADDGLTTVGHLEL
ncbi:hypothetical protein niasHS_004840 [Heterodera schachtii]|uniref:Uncharacterized protein n=1 Tax=Heterodera schachtii TaxID=97005 RepID=A0ABD2K0Z4_HETSC